MRRQAPVPSDDQVRTFYSALPSGRANAITARALSARLSLGRNGDRALRALAQAATDAGLLVCADNAGYYTPATADEARETIGRLRSQAAHMADRARRMQALIDRLFGRQGTLL